MWLTSINQCTSVLSVASQVHMETAHIALCIFVPQTPPQAPAFGRGTSSPLTLAYSHPCKNDTKVKLDQFTPTRLITRSYTCTCTGNHLHTIFQFHYSHFFFSHHNPTQYFWCTVLHHPRQGISKTVITMDYF